MGGDEGMAHMKERGGAARLQLLRLDVEDGSPSALDLKKMVVCVRSGARPGGVWV